jgi:hypothetical protein
MAHPWLAVSSVISEPAIAAHDCCATAAFSDEVPSLLSTTIMYMHESQHCVVATTMYLVSDRCDIVTLRCASFRVCLVFLDETDFALDEAFSVRA